MIRDLTPRICIRPVLTKMVDQISAEKNKQKQSLATL